VPHQSASLHRHRTAKAWKRRNRGEAAYRRDEDNKTNDKAGYRKGPGDRTNQGDSDNGERCNNDNDRSKNKNSGSYRVQLSRRGTQNNPSPTPPQHQITDSGYNKGNTKSHNELVPDKDGQGCDSTIAPPMDLTETTTINTILPPEVILHIFQFVPLKYLGYVMQVCKWWKEISDTPRLWSTKYIVINRYNISLMPRALTTWRLSTVNEIIMEMVSTEALEAVNDHETIRHMQMNTMLSSIMGKTLATTIKKKEGVNISNT
jgi:hypothetical protein